MTKTLEDSKKQNTLIKSSLLATKKPWKADTKSGKNRGKKPAAGGTNAKGKKGGSKKKGGAGTSMDYTVASIPRSVDWPVSFQPGIQLQSTY